MQYTSDPDDRADLYTPRWAYPLDEAAELIGVSVWTVRRLIDAGHLVCVQTPGRGTRRKRVVEGNELLRYLRENRQEEERR